MKTAFTELVGVEHPLVAFNRSAAVVTEASKAGALGVLAAAAYSPEELDAQLTWIEKQLNGAPYGVDLLVSRTTAAGDPSDLMASLRSQIPAEHIEYLDDLMKRYGIEPLPEGARLKHDGQSLDPSFVPLLLEVCFSHDLSLIANALGTPPAAMLEGAKSAGVPIAALVGRREHAERQLVAGVDVLVAQGYEAGGHTGTVASMVLTPEVVSVAGDVPVLAAGGIASGDQLAAALALGAAGGWAGSVWLSTVEDVAITAIKDKFLAASSSDTLRSPSRTGKPARQLRSAWHDEWERSGISALPMPLQSVLTAEAWERTDRAAEAGNPQAIALESFFIGQVVGSFTSVRTTAEVVADIMGSCERRLRYLGALT
jgi:NAD(P)H-dependent flavin oxidoreductase YrpB (nitropropane dioxygenase family)